MILPSIAVLVSAMLPRIPVLVFVIPPSRAVLLRLCDTPTRWPSPLSMSSFCRFHFQKKPSTTQHVVNPDKRRGYRLQRIYALRTNAGITQAFFVPLPPPPSPTIHIFPVFVLYLSFFPCFSSFILLMCPKVVSRSTFLTFAWYGSDRFE
ncbi:hypothetical protein GGI42DRAFT_190237 [Trichoderma sp. SZMC 28013]